MGVHSISINTFHFIDLISKTFDGNVWESQRISNHSEIILTIALILCLDAVL